MFTLDCLNLAVFNNNYICNRFYSDLNLVLKLGPSAPPANVHLQCVGLSSITIMWEPVPQDSRSGPLKGYRVRYRQSFSHGSYGEIKTGFWLISATKATLNDLEKDSVYRIEIAGETNVGIGVYSEPVTAKTGKFKAT